MQSFATPQFVTPSRWGTSSTERYLSPIPLLLPIRTGRCTENRNLEDGFVHFLCSRPSASTHGSYRGFRIVGAEVLRASPSWWRFGFTIMSCALRNVAVLRHGFGRSRSLVRNQTRSTMPQWTSILARLTASHGWLLASVAPLHPPRLHWSTQTGIY